MDKFVLLLVLLSRAASDVTVAPGGNVTLECLAGDASIRAVEWTRPDLESPQYVLFYSDGHSDTTYQHASFEDRVQLVDSELKNGDVSLILKNVSSNDAGTYECRVAAGGPRRSRRANIENQPIRSIRLEVTDSGSKSGNILDGNHAHGHVGLVVGFVLVVCLAVGTFVVWKYKRQTDKKSEPSSAVEAGDDQLI